MWISRGYVCLNIYSFSSISPFSISVSLLFLSFCCILNTPYFLYLRFFSDSYIYLLPQFFSPHIIPLFASSSTTSITTPPCFPRSIFLFFASFHSIRPTSSFLPSFFFLSLSLFTPDFLFRFPFACSTSLQRRTHPLSLHLARNLV